MNELSVCYDNSPQTREESRHQMRSYALYVALGMAGAGLRSHPEYLPPGACWMVAGVVLFWCVGFLSALEIDATRRMLGVGLLFWAAFAIVVVPEPWHFLVCMGGAMMAYWQLVPLSAPTPSLAASDADSCDTRPAEILEEHPLPDGQHPGVIAVPDQSPRRRGGLGCAGRAPVPSARYPRWGERGRRRPPRSPW